MILDRAKRATSSTLIQPGQFSTAPLRLAYSTPGDGAWASGVAAFPRRPIAFLWHYIRRRPLLHLSALASVLVAASCACAAQYGLKMIVDAMAQGIDHIAVAWRALAVFAGLLAGESLLWRFGSWLGYRAYDKHEAQVRRDLFVQTARQGAVNLTTISYTEVDADVQRILDSATGAFRDDFDKRSKPFIEVVKVDTF